MEKIESLKNSDEPSDSKQPASLDDTISRAGTSTRIRTGDQLETYDYNNASPLASFNLAPLREHDLYLNKGSKMDSEAQTSHVKIYRPYDIEEPDDDTGPSIQGLEIPSLPDYFERWQRDLVDDIEGTQSDPSEYATTQLHVDPTRGQKRKPTSSAGLEDHSRSGIRPRDEAVASQCRSIPKRRRRRSKLPNDFVKTAPVQSLYDFRDPQLNESSSSSSDYWSTDGSADSMQESAITDDMDID